MGNVKSDPRPEFEVSHSVRTTETSEPIIQMLDEKEFVCKFDPRMRTLAESLWRRFSQQDFIDHVECRKLVEELTSSEDKMLFFVKLAAWPQQKLGEKNLRLLLSWLSYGATLTPSLEATLLKPFYSLVQSSDTDVGIIAARFSSLLPDTAEDLNKIVVYSLKSSTPISLDFRISSEFTSIMTPGLLWLLSVSLNASFKRSCTSLIHHGPPLEIEQLAHLHLLYNSGFHGFSITRIKELSFDYHGPLIMFLKTEKYLFCLASETGLKDSLKTFGTEHSLLLQIQPDFAKLVSGHASKFAEQSVGSGIIYANFTAKTARRGLLIGHQPLASPAVEVNEGFTELRFAGGPPMKLVAVEIWAAGSRDSLTKLQAQHAWDLEQVNKEKNRKFKLEEDWRDSVDRRILDMAGVEVNYSAKIEAHKAELSSGFRSANKR